MLELSHVCIGYGGADVVRDISFTMSANECLCVVGPNGCGKTTLLKAIAGLLPYSGEILLSGAPVRAMGSKDMARRVALLSQVSGIYFSYSVEDTVMMGRYARMRGGLWGAPSAADREAVENSLIAADLIDDRGKEISRLSGGQLQRVFLARALAQDPDIILLDEPTNHLDLKYQVELVDYLREWRLRPGKAVIGVLHDINLAMRLADRVMLMRGGAVHAIGAVNDMFTPGALREVFNTDVAGYMLESLGRWERVVDA